LTVSGKAINDGEIGSDGARRSRPAKLPVLHGANTEPVTTGELRLREARFRETPSRSPARNIVLVCTQRDLTTSMRCGFLQSINHVLPRATEPLRPALTNALAFWHLSNPPRTSSLPSDPQRPYPIDRFWSGSKTNMSQGSNNCLVITSGRSPVMVTNLQTNHTGFPYSCRWACSSLFAAFVYAR
jgi:hypothetical protein